MNDLRDKADKWELHNVENENRRLKSQIQELERKIEYLESSLSNRRYLLERLIAILADNPNMQENSDEIRGLNTYL